jgi:hypothetical protein
MITVGANIIVEEVVGKGLPELGGSSPTGGLAVGVRIAVAVCPLAYAAEVTVKALIAVSAWAKANAVLCLTVAVILALLESDAVIIVSVSSGIAELGKVG